MLDGREIWTRMRFCTFVKTRNGDFLCKIIIVVENYCMKLKLTVIVSMSTVL